MDNEKKQLINNEVMEQKENEPTEDELKEAKEEEALRMAA